MSRDGARALRNGERWRPMRRGQLNPDAMRAYRDAGIDTAKVSAWGNGLYDATVRELSTSEEGGLPMLHISFKRMDRAPVHDWRHWQAIKNDIAGPERYAVEIFPPESLLVDTANEYHLWVFPEGVDLGFGFKERLVYGPEMVEETNDEIEKQTGVRGKGRQRSWQAGLTTG